MRGITGTCTSCHQTADIDSATGLCQDCESTTREGGDPVECEAQLIDGQWTYCGCDDCEQRETDEHEDKTGTGYIPGGWS
jgi:hypothetical protein